MFVCVLDELGEVCYFCFAPHVVEGALFDSVVCWVSCIRWGGGVNV